MGCWPNMAMAVPPALCVYSTEIADRENPPPPPRGEEMMGGGDGGRQTNAPKLKNIICDVWRFMATKHKNKYTYDI